ncbi:hypothetical protein AAHE18_01G114400 [Arachis hypogaea]
MIVLKGSVPIAFGGNEQPAAYGELVSIGGLNPDMNKKLSAGIDSILENKLSVLKGIFLSLGKKRGELKLLWTRGEPEMPCPHNQESQY